MNQCPNITVPATLIMRNESNMSAIDPGTARGSGTKTENVQSGGTGPVCP